MNYVMGFGQGAIVAGLVALAGIVLFFVVGLPLIHRLGGGVSRLFLQNDDSFGVMPEYSLAEACAQKGKYAEAVEEYRQVITQHPDDIYPHLRIADLALTQLNDTNLAEQELLSAFDKASGQDSLALAAGRLADLYQHRLHDVVRALEVMKQLREKIPDSKQAKLAEERIAALERLAKGETLLPVTPEKIPIRPSRYRMPD